MAIEIHEYPNPMAEFVDSETGQCVVVRTIEDCYLIIDSMTRMACEIDPDWQGMEVK